MKKILSILSLMLITTITNAQVGINTSMPDPSSMLDVKSDSKGILIPRMTKTERENIAQPENGLLVYDTTRQCLSQNVGDKTNPDWVCLGNNVRFFYMPSMVINTDNIGDTPQVDLFSVYKNQFETPKVKSPLAPQSIPYFSSSDDLYYYVTYYDEAVIKDVHITDAGLMTYRVVGEPTDLSYMNIVFVVK